MTDGSPDSAQLEKKQAGAPKKKAGRPRRTDWQATFLEAYSLHGIICRAAKHAHVDQGTVADERKRNPTFALAMEDAREEAADNLETFAHKWATTGLEERHEEISYDAEGHVTARKVRVTANVSPTLLIFLLKAMRPAKYRETFRVENTGADGGPIRVQVKGAAEEFFAELDRLALPPPTLPVLEAAPAEAEPEPTPAE